MKKVGLVLEGGAMRGMYTAGVIDILMENNINIDGIIGTSAGALFGVNYFSKQKGRVIRYSKRFCKDIRYISMLSYLLTGNVVNKNFAYYKVTKKYDIFDNDTFKEFNKDYYVTMTNVETGKAEYKRINDPVKEMEYLRASSAMPLVTKLVKIDDKKYLDGAISDSIPVDKMKSLGYDKIIVVLTQPYDYRKEELNEKQLKKINKKYKKYPKLIKSMINRPKKYNETLEKIIELENEKDIYVIRPSEKLNINVIERNKNKLEEIYNIGQEDTKNIINDLKKYINKK